MSFRRILIALDDSAIAAHAAEVGLELAISLKAQAALVYVVDPAPALQADSGISAAEWAATLNREGQAFLATTAQRIGQPPAWQFLREGKPADQILATAREWGSGCDCDWHTRAIGCLTTAPWEVRRSRWCGMRRARFSSSSRTPDRFFV